MTTTATLTHGLDLDTLPPTIDIRVQLGRAGEVLVEWGFEGGWYTLDEYIAKVTG